MGMTNNDKQQELKTIDSENFRDMIIAALNWLQQQKSFIDSLNVFPVPDGDTGTNMFLTFKEAAAAWKTMIQIVVQIWLNHFLKVP